MQGYNDDKDAIQKRLRRIEGQVRGLQRMVDEDKYCIEILDQVVRLDGGGVLGDPAVDDPGLPLRLRPVRPAPRRTTRRVPVLPVLAAPREHAAPQALPDGCPTDGPAQSGCRHGQDPSAS